MLRTLSIRDFVIVDSLELEFHSGFTVLTGETGAGKSILIDALALTLGERGDAAVVRAGCERADISAEFDIQLLPALELWLRAAELDGDAGLILLRRVIDKNGRSRAFVNGRPATLSQLREAGEWLVDIHGQHAHQSLLKADAQRVLLDAHAGLAAARGAGGGGLSAWQKLAQARTEYETHAAQRNAEREQLQWQALNSSSWLWRPRNGRQCRRNTRGWPCRRPDRGRAGGARYPVRKADAACLPLLSGAGARGWNSAGLRRAPARGARAHPLGRGAGAGGGVCAAPLCGSPRSSIRDGWPRWRARMEAIHGSARKFRLAPQELPEHLRRLQARLSRSEIASDLEALVKQEQQARTSYFELAAKLSAGRKKGAAKLGKEVSAGDATAGHGRWQLRGGA